MAFDYAVNLINPSAEPSAIDNGLVADLNAALSAWSNYITGATGGTVEVALEITDLPVIGAAGGPAAVVDAGTTASGISVEESAADYVLRSGVQPAGATADINVYVDPRALPVWYIDPNPSAGNPVPMGAYDGFSALLHEVGHGLAFSGYYDTQSNAAALTDGGGYESPFDTFISATPDGNAYFTGPKAEKVNGGPVALTTIGPAGSDYYHLENDQTDVMTGTVLTTGVRYQPSSLDLAIMADTGIPVTSYLDAVPCFCAGTPIFTDNGHVPVESLRPGDLVRTKDGRLVPVKWIGQRRCAGRPVRFHANCIASGVPHEDVLLSPDHAVLVNGVLVNAHRLLNGISVTRESLGSVLFVHVELDQHDILSAAGMDCESYLDTGNRGQFDREACLRPLCHEAPADGLRRTLDAYRNRGYAPLCLDNDTIWRAHQQIAARCWEKFALAG